MTIAPATIYKMLKAHIDDRGTDNLGKLSRDIAALFPASTVEPIGYVSRPRLDEFIAHSPGVMITLAAKGTFRPENEVPVYLAPPVAVADHTRATYMTSQAVIDYVAGIAYAVEATRAEQMWLWKDHHRDAGWSWTDERSGYIARVGELDDRPVMISIMKAVVQGQSVLFWHPTSVVVDHDMIEAWFRQHMPDTIKIDVDGFQALVQETRT